MTRANSSFRHNNSAVVAVAKETKPLVKVIVEEREVTS